MGAGIMASAVRSANALDHVVFALPRMDDKYKAFLDALPDAQVVQPLAPTMAGSSSAKAIPDVGLAKRELMALLNVDVMALAATRAAIDPATLKTPEGCKGAARAWLDGLTDACVESLADTAVPKLVISRLVVVLRSNAANADPGLSDGERSLREDFQSAAQALVKEHFKLQRQVPVNGGLKLDTTES